jgi:uncharacterized protein YbjT (DUF2867 family)
MQDGFVKVDHDYVVNVARVAKEAGCKHFNLVTSTGANANSPMLYPQTKVSLGDNARAGRAAPWARYHCGKIHVTRFWVR